MNLRCRRLLRGMVVGVFCASSLLGAGEDVLLSPKRFVADAFKDGPEAASDRLWITSDVRPAIKSILGHDYPALRLRYWQRGTRTAWILEEIGKVKPITTGIVIDEGKISSLHVLVYRESHGWEVKHRFFTDQFRGAQLTSKLELDQPIEGIAGATLSVNALRKLGRLGLYLDGQVQDSSGS